MYWRIGARGRSGSQGGGAITTTTGLAAFNDQPVAEAERRLRSCCASAEWARQIAAGRPYPDLAAVLEAGAAALAGLAWPEIAQALAAHPRIGDRVTGDDRDSAWSRREQAGMRDAGAADRAALAQANREYEERFGHRFLIFASGRTGPDLLAAARTRLRNGPGVEREVVRDELGKITRLRLERMLG